jgi:hypothetical protein
MSVFKEGDIVRFADDSDRYEVRRVEEWDQQVLVISNIEGELDPRHTFKVRADEVYRVPTG